MIAELVTLLIAGPVALWLTSPRRIARRAVRRWEHIATEVVQLMALPMPSAWPPAAPSGRTCAAGSTGAREVCAAPGAPAASTRAAEPARVRPPTGQARHVVGPPSSPGSGPTTSHRRIRMVL